jgi:hypothetical protein
VCFTGVKFDLIYFEEKNIISNKMLSCVLIAKSKSGFCVDKDGKKLCFGFEILHKISLQNQLYLFETVDKKK